MKITYQWKVSGQQAAPLSLYNDKINPRKHNSHRPRRHVTLLTL